MKSILAHSRFFLILLPVSSILLTPLGQAFSGTGALLTHFRFIVLLVGFVALGLSLALHVLSVRLEARGCPFVIPNLILCVWVVVFLLYFSIHIETAYETLRSQIPAGVLAVLISLFTILRNRSRVPSQIMTAVSVAFLLETGVGLRQIRFFEIPQKPSELRTAAAESPHVFHLLFDTLGFASQDPDRFEAEIEKLTNEHNLTLYRNHYTTGAPTRVSVPDLLRVDRSQENGSEGLRGVGDNHLFRAFRQSGYYVRVYGEAMPYCLRFSEWVDECRQRTRSERRIESELFAGVVLQASAISPRLSQWLLGASSHELLETNPGSSLDLIEELLATLPRIASGPPSYNYVHVLLPHSPYVLDDECRRRSFPSHSDRDANGVLWAAEYRAQSHCAIKVIDRILTEIEEVGLSERVRLVIHSDHAAIPSELLKDSHGVLASDLIRRLTHIPVWTKGVGQLRSETVSELTSNADLAGYLLEHARHRLPKRVSTETSFGGVRYRTSDGNRWSRIERNDGITPGL